MRGVASERPRSGEQRSWSARPDSACPRHWQLAPPGPRRAGTSLACDQIVDAMGERAPGSRPSGAAVEVEGLDVVDESPVWTASRVGSNRLRSSRWHHPRSMRCGWRRGRYTPNTSSPAEPDRSGSFLSLTSRRALVLAAVDRLGDEVVEDPGRHSPVPGVSEPLSDALASQVLATVIPPRSRHFGDGLAGIRRFRGMERKGHRLLLGPRF